MNFNETFITLAQEILLLFWEPFDVYTKHAYFSLKYSWYYSPWIICFSLCVFSKNIYESGSQAEWPIDILYLTSMKYLFWLNKSFRGISTPSGSRAWFSLFHYRTHNNVQIGLLHCLFVCQQLYPTNNCFHFLLNG